MIEGLPAYVSATFLISVFAAVIIFGSAVRKTADLSFAGKLTLVLLPFWMLFHAVLALGGFYQDTSSLPPRLLLFGPLPALLFIVGLLLFARYGFIDRLSLKTFTILHIIRIPVEIVLYWLFIGGAVPEAMTLHGSNFDILSGITAPIAYFFGFRAGKVNRNLLIVWNIAALVLVLAIVAISILSFPSPMQSIAFDQPNRAVIFFPYIWLPTLIVPIVLFAHLASLYRLLTNRLA
jgi:hypothetical protein